MVRPHRYPPLPTTTLTRFSGFIKSTRQACQSDQGSVQSPSFLRSTCVADRGPLPLVGSRTNWVPRWCYPSARRVHGRHDTDDYPKRQGPRSGRGHSRVVGKRARSPVSALLGPWVRCSTGGRLTVACGKIRRCTRDLARLVLYARPGLKRCRVSLASLLYISLYTTCVHFAVGESEQQDIPPCQELLVRDMSLRSTLNAHRFGNCNNYDIKQLKQEKENGTG
jgi:hypothetical protein